MLTQLYPVQKTWWHTSIVLRRVCWMSCRFLMVQLQAGQILTACEEGHKFSKRSTKSDQLSCPVHFLFSSTDNYNCYLVRPCKLSHFLWAIPMRCTRSTTVGLEMLQGAFPPVPFLFMDQLSINLCNPSWICQWCLSPWSPVVASSTKPTWGIVCFFMRGTLEPAFLIFFLENFGSCTPFASK